MAWPPQARAVLAKPDRRFFLSSLGSLGTALVLSNRELKAENRSEPRYRFRTPECEVRMSVQFLANSSTEGFHFRDRLTNRTFCLSASGREDHGCLERFVGAMAIARYAFRSPRHSAAPLNLRERVLIIDNDSGMSPPPPFERALAIEREMASDIQAFGYDPDHLQPTAYPQQASRCVASAAPGLVSQRPNNRLSHRPLEAHAGRHQPGRRDSRR